jgi:hypothetical protein
VPAGAVGLSAVRGQALHEQALCEKALCEKALCGQARCGQEETAAGAARSTISLTSPATVIRATLSISSSSNFTP